ncbi:MAG: hypothetical protein U5K36_09955 [Roseovarius sp.]|nr:hypothetical protein [Roseovarius sp.]
MLHDKFEPRLDISLRQYDRLVGANGTWDPKAYCRSGWWIFPKGKLAGAYLRAQCLSDRWPFEFFALLLLVSGRKLIWQDRFAPYRRHLSPRLHSDRTLRALIK